MIEINENVSDSGHLPTRRRTGNTCGKASLAAHQMLGDMRSRMNTQFKFFRYEHPMQTMLSPHEMTTLMIAWDAPDQIELDRDEIVTLIEHRLIALDEPASGRRRVQVTEQGRAVLKAVLRIR